MTTHTYIASLIKSPPKLTLPSLAALSQPHSRVRTRTASAAASVADASPAGRGTADPVGATTSCEQGRDTQTPSPGQKAVVVFFPHRSLASAHIHTANTHTTSRSCCLKKVASAGRGGSPKCVCGPNPADRPTAHAPPLRAHLVLLRDRASNRHRVVWNHCFVSVHAGCRSRRKSDPANHPTEK